MIDRAGNSIRSWRGMATRYRHTELVSIVRGKCPSGFLKASRHEQMLSAFGFEQVDEIRDSIGTNNRVLAFTAEQTCHLWREINRGIINNNPLAGGTINILSRSNAHLEKRVSFRSDTFGYRDDHMLPAISALFVVPEGGQSPISQEMRSFGQNQP